MWMPDADDRTELPTPRRLEEARSSGSAPRSAELCAAIVLLAASLALPGIGPQLWRGALLLWEEAAPSWNWVSSGGPLGRESAMPLAGSVLAILGLAAVAAILANVAQFGFRMTPGVVRPRWSRIQPQAGLARWRGGGLRSAGQVLKAACVLAVLAWNIADGLELALSLPAGDSAADLAASIGGLVTQACLKVSIVLLALALADVAWERRRYLISLRMTRQEVLDEERAVSRRRAPAGVHCASVPGTPPIEVDTKRTAAVHVQS